MALKVIARHLASDEAFRGRFLRESRLAARLDHPNVVPVFDAREEDGELFVAMRLVDGGDLTPIAAEVRCRRPRLPSCSARSPTRSTPPTPRHRPPRHQAAQHPPRRPAGLPHRLRPRQALGDSGAPQRRLDSGTVEYMSPEQWQARRVGPTTDIYSLGCVLYGADGIVPYARKEDDTEPEMPAGLDEVIERAVAKEPSAATRRQAP